VVAGGAVQIATVDVRNVGFKDYWLPLYGQPISVAGLSGRWTYDERTGTAYTARPRAEDGWQQMADFSVPTAGQLRDARGSTGPVAAYLNTAGVDRRVIDLADQVTGRAGTPFDKAIALQDFFTGPSSGFQYSLQTAPGNGDDALVEFLTQGKTGYCEQFAAAMAVMLRAVGVPARVAVGFTGGTPDGDHRSISTSDAHAWVEAWFPGRGWLIFDPTPLTDGRTIVPPYVAEGPGRAGRGGGRARGRRGRPRAPPGTDPGADAHPGAHGPGRPGPRRARRRAAAVAVRLGGLVVLLVGGVLTPALLRARARKQRLAAVAAGGPGAAARAGPSCSPSRPTGACPPRRATPCGRPPAASCASTTSTAPPSTTSARWWGWSRPAGTADRTPPRARSPSRSPPWWPRSRRPARSRCASGCFPARCSTGARRRPVPHDDAAAPDGRGGGVG
jgi:hypothetical protein